MTWDLTEPDFPFIELKQNHVHGLCLWLEKVAEMAIEYGGEWDTLIADIWPNDNYSRLIGHVQMKNKTIGYDTGFRVTAYLQNGGIVGDSGDDTALVEKWLRSAVDNPNTQRQLVKLANRNAFEIRLTSWGEGAIGDAIEIVFQ